MNHIKEAGYNTIQLMAITIAEDMSGMPGMALPIENGGEGYLNFMDNKFGHPEWIDFPVRETAGGSMGSTMLNCTSLPVLASS